ncbi:cathepsin B-like cysteine proteinase [Lycorma delicatula]|uniref:cathepsin B-like cysteine proteinase n=1 Tax=Lycorma delicatula TaxID=130591 RepID=UPI003F511F77
MPQERLTGLALLHIHYNKNNIEPFKIRGKNFDPNLPANYAKLLLGWKKRQSSESSLSEPKPIHDIAISQIPKEFDARKKWNYCKSLNEIRDQGGCGSCWAVAAASAFTDRLCIATKGKFNGHLSAHELLSCCTSCGDGCQGGYSDNAWNYLKTHGIVTGGDYNSRQGCQPYPIEPCEHHVQGPRPVCPPLELIVTPPCVTTCTNNYYVKPYHTDHYKVESTYKISREVTDIQKEILKHGPVESGFNVLPDFLAYKSGVYQPTPGLLPIGGHAVKVIGWGIEKNLPYWLVQNSWNYDWGDNGLFKIIRGNDTLGFETGIVAGIPSCNVTGEASYSRFINAPKLQTDTLGIRVACAQALLPESNAKCRCCEAVETLGMY